MWKKMISIALALVIALSCVGCGSKEISAEDASSTEVVKIGDEVIHLDYMYLYAIQFIYTYKTQDGTVAENEDSYKEQILSQLRTDEIEYQYAKANGIELTDDEKKQMDEVVDRYYETFPEEFLAKYGITRDVVTELFCRQRYITELTDQETTKLQDQYKKEATDQFKDTDFYQLKYLLFPTVEYKNGKPVTDSNGKYTELSSADKKNSKNQAEEAKKRLEDGEDIDALAKEYGIEDMSDEIRAYRGAYTDKLEKLIKDLKTNDVSDVYKDDLGYMVVLMVNDNDTEYKDYYIEAAANQKAQDELTNVKQEWLSTVEVDTEKDIIGNTWDDMDLAALAKAMESAGIIKE